MSAIYTVRIKRVVWHDAHVRADSPEHAVARAQMLCPASGLAWDIKSEKCEIMASGDGKALSRSWEE